jgi:hypothetical protein
VRVQHLHRIARQQRDVHGLDRAQVGDGQPALGGQHVQGRQVFAVRGGGDHGRARRDGRHLAGQGVGPAQVPGHEAHGEAPALVQGDHRRVFTLAAQVRRHGADHDARRRHEHVAAVGPEHRAHEGHQGVEGRGAGVVRLQAAGHEQVGLQGPGQGAAQARPGGVSA